MTADHVGGHRALGVARVVGLPGGTVAVAIAAQVGRDDGEAARQGGRHTVPAGARLRVAVQQQQRRPVAGEGHRDGVTSPSDRPRLEAGEHPLGSCQPRGRFHPRRPALTIPCVPALHAYPTAPPPLMGRADLLGELVVLVGGAPGRDRGGRAGRGSARPAAGARGRRAPRHRRRRADRRGRGPGPGQERLARALAAAGHDPDPARAARLRPMVVLMGDVGDEPAVARRPRAAPGAARAASPSTPPETWSRTP